uniref:Piwi domain-containing protein n=1 Tax=Araucaria cunninghamii TaxID=56994 RepID=A0A0D6R7G7_ARACU
MASPGEEGGVPPMTEGGGPEVNLPPPPPLPAEGFVPQQVVQVQNEPLKIPPQMPQPPQPRLVPMKRPGKGRVGRPVKLLSNHFGVSFTNLQDSFHYNVTISSDRGLITNKTLLRKIMDKMKDVYGKTELDGKEFAYDGEKSMFTIGALSRNNIECTVLLEEASGMSAGGVGDNGRKKIRRDDRAEKFKVEISFAAKISMKSLNAALQGEVSDKCQDALRVLDIILRQHAARKDYILVRQSFFHWSFAPLVDLGGGVQGCKGYHVSFRPSQRGLSLNMDASTTMLIKQGFVIDFLVHNQGVSDPSYIDWLKARRVLKGVRIKAIHTDMEHKILGFSEKPCKDQLFSLKVKNQGNQESGSPPQTVEVTVLEYFANTKNINLKYSATLPCVDVGRAKRPNYIPVELCQILPGQRYTKGLNTSQRTSLVEQSRQKPEDRMDVLLKAMFQNDYNSDPLLRACNINVDRQLMQIEGRILEPPKLKFGTLEEAPQRGRWNFNNKTMHRAGRVQNWAVVNFTRSNESEVHRIANDLSQCCRRKGLELPPPNTLVNENPRDKNANPVDRVERVFNQLRARINKPPDFLLCLLPERKTSDLYGPWKKKFLSDMGVITQCIVPTRRMNDQYYTNVSLKINAKIGGLNSVLAVELGRRVPKISEEPTIIIGMDVSHGSPGHGDSPSIAAVVSSREWPLISRYRASVRTQSRKVEMIEALYKPLPDGKKDAGMINELLIDFYNTCKPPPGMQGKPRRMIIFRDGVSESQFDQVLNVEIQAIIKACNHIEAGYKPKITLIIAQKNHHTKLFQTGQTGNVQPGTIVDTQICHPRNYDFFLCPQNGPIGTSRPTHYHVLLDENNFTVDDLQILVHALSYVYQRSTTAISSVAPINYAHLAATQMQQFLKAEELSESASRSGRGEGSVASGGGGNVPELPKLHATVRDSMFFC